MKKIQKSKVKKLCLVLAVLIVVVVGTLAILPVFSPKVEAGEKWGIYFKIWLFHYCEGDPTNCVVVWP